MYYSSNQYFHKGTIPGHTMTFSSYPGTLMSGDDYYLISSGLVGLIVKGDCILLNKCGLIIGNQWLIMRRSSLHHYVCAERNDA